MKRPAFQFYPADWRKDNELQSCSIAARGLWIEMICLAHECDPYGYLMVNGHPMTDKQIAQRAGVAPREFVALLLELATAGVARRAENGALFSQRMIKDEGLRAARAAGGQAGAEHGAKGAAHGTKGGRPKAKTGDKKPPLNPPPSSSTSSSSSPSGKEDALRAKANPVIPIPDWIPRDTWDSYIAMRKQIKKPMTPQAMVLAISKLQKMRAEGQDITEVLENSILGSYQGLFPVKHQGNGNGQRAKPPSANDKFLAASGAIISEFLGGPEGGDDSGPANEISRPLLSA